MRTERGSVTVLLVGILVFGFTLVVALAGIGQVVVARAEGGHRRRSWSAGGGPGHVPPVRSIGIPHHEAAKMVRANGAVLVRCACPHDPGYGPRTAVVTARLRTAILGLREVTLEATAAAEFTPVALLGVSQPGGGRPPG